MRISFLIGPVMAISLCSAGDFRTGYFRGQKIVFENVEGEAIYHGDIILGATADIEGGAPARSAAANRHTASLTVTASKPLWPGGVIPYVIDTALPGTQQQAVTQAINHWNTRTPVHLVQRTTENNYVRFTTSTSTIACSSSIGMVGGQQSIRLPTGCGVGETIHEIGHAAGLWHEQERNDRNRFITVEYENIDKANATQFDQVFDQGIDAGPYDFNSIMHYGAFDFSRDGLASAMETVPAGIPLGQRTALSFGDIDAINRLYGKPSGKLTIATTPPGLKVRVDGALVDDGATFTWAPGSQHTVEAPFQGDTQARYLSGSWSDGGAAIHTINAAADRTLIVANFIRQFRVSTNIAGSGSVTLDPPPSDGFYNDRANVFINAVPANGSSFVRWSITPSRSLNPKWITIQSPTVVQATFATGPVITLNSNSPGRIVLVDGAKVSTPVNYSWPKGESHSVDIDTTQPDFVHYRFTGWDDGSPQARTVVSTGQAATYTANYVAQYSVVPRITSISSPGRINVNPSATGSYYDEGTEVQLSAATSSAFTFIRWDGDLAGNTNPSMLTVDGQKLVYATFGPAGSAPVLTVVNAASGGSDAIAPGEIVTIYGSNIGPPNPAGIQTAGGRVMTQSGGAEVLFDGEPAPITFASINQINAVVPYGVRGRSSTKVQVRYNGQTSAAVPIDVQDAMPAIFTLTGTGTGAAAVLNQDGSVNSVNRPARRGSIVVIYATGEGITNPLVPDGQIATAVYPKPVLPVSVRIGGQPAVIHYAGAAPSIVAGALQLNVQIPDGVRAGGNVPVTLVIGDAASPSGVTIAVD